MSTVAVVLVTHESAVHLPDTLASVLAQDRSADVLIAVDDRSGDETPTLLEAAGFTVHASTSSSPDTRTRIAHNFHQGLRHARACGADVVVFGDHDDLWHPERVGHQVRVLEDDPRAAMVASDGYLIDENSVAIPGTIRDTFPVPTDFDAWGPRRQWAYALRHSLATGGASAVRPAALTDWSIPSGWLHDRWWSLAALRRHALRIDRMAVIDYRLSPDQQVGLDTSRQDDAGAWIADRLRDSGRSVSRSVDLLRLR